MTLLVAYTSRRGATEGIAEFIGVRLAERGIATDVRRVDAVDGLHCYDAIVLGAPVYDQRWPAEAREFVARFAELLTAGPFWLFSVGSFGDTQPLVGRAARREPKDIDALRAALHPRDYRVFRGVIQKNQWPWWSGLVFHLFGGRFGDRREWSVIAVWAEQIARELKGIQSALG